MKLNLFLILVFSSLVCFAQNEPKAVSANGDAWMRIESDAKDFSFAVPQNFVVDNEDGEFRVYSSRNGVTFRVEMEFKKNYKKEFQKNLAFIKDFSKYEMIQADDFIGMRYLDKTQDGKLYIQLQLVSSNGVYTVSAYSKDLTNDDYLRFLQSLRVGNKLLFIQKVNYPAEQRSVLLSSLKTDEIVLNALRREDGAQTKMEKATDEEKEKPADNTKYSRELFILRQPRPGYTDLARQRSIQGTVKLRVTFLAGGQIGPIKLVSPLDGGLEKRAFQAAKKIKFIPAEVDGKPVDVTKFIEYRFSVY